MEQAVSCTKMLRSLQHPLMMIVELRSLCGTTLLKFNSISVKHVTFLFILFKNSLEMIKTHYKYTYICGIKLKIPNHCILLLLLLLALVLVLLCLIRILTDYRIAEKKDSY